MAEIGDVLLEPVPGGKPGQRRIKPAEWPDPAFVDVGVRGDLQRVRRRARRRPRTASPARSPSTKFIDAVAAVMGRRMETDERIVVMGEDVHRLNGGTNGATKGLADALPGPRARHADQRERVRRPRRRHRARRPVPPVVEFMYADFMWVAADQLFNQIGKARHMFGGDDDVPLVLRSKVAMGTGYGSQHSMDPAGIFATAPGWRIVAPSTPFDYVGLMNTALRCKDPVLVLEHVDLYGSTGDGPGRRPRLLPAGRQGGGPPRPATDVTVLTYLAMTQLRPGGGRARSASRRRGHRPALARPRQHRLGHHRREHPQDQQRADRRAGRAAARRTAAGWPTRSSAGSSTGSTTRCERVTGGEASPSISKVLERAAIAQDRRSRRPRCAEIARY